MNSLKFFMNLTDEQHRKFFFRRQSHPDEPPIESLSYAIMRKKNKPGNASYIQQRMLLNLEVYDPTFKLPYNERRKVQHKRIKKALVDLSTIDEEAIESLKGLKRIPIAEFSQ